LNVFFEKIIIRIRQNKKSDDVSIFLFIFAVVNHLLLIRLRKNLFARRTYIDRDFQYYNFNKKKKHDEKNYFLNGRLGESN
jgi:hypothetical protein